MTSALLFSGGGAVPRDGVRPLGGPRVSGYNAARGLRRARCGLSILNRTTAPASLIEAGAVVSQVITP